MKKAILKVYIKNKLTPLFVADIYDDVEKTLEEFKNKLNDRSLNVITFGNITFSKDLFKMFKVIYK